MGQKLERTENGEAVLTTASGGKVVALDAVAKLAGVSGGAVAKVLAALDLIAAYSDVSADDLVNYYNIPLAAADESRSQSTHDYVEELAMSAYGAGDPGKYLKLDERIA